MTTQHCNRCRKDKNTNHFGSFKECESCRDGRRKYRKERGGDVKHNAREKKYRENNPFRFMIKQSKEADESHGRLPIDMSTYATKELLMMLWSLQEGRCCRCEVPMQLVNRRQATGCTIQRQNDRLGHLTDNVILYCHKCNMEDRWYNYNKHE